MASISDPTRHSLVWARSLTDFAQDPIASIALSREGWEALGAHFFAVDDGIGGIAHLATGSIEVITDRRAGLTTRTVPVGVLDHDEDITRLLAPRDLAGPVLEALVVNGLPLDAILDRRPVDPAVLTPDERLARIERELVELRQLVAARR